MACLRHDLSILPHSSHDNNAPLRVQLRVSRLPPLAALAAAQRSAALQLQPLPPLPCSSRGSKHTRAFKFGVGILCQLQHVRLDPVKTHAQVNCSYQGQSAEHKRCHAALARDK